MIFGADRNGRYEGGSTNAGDKSDDLRVFHDVRRYRCVCATGVRPAGRRNVDGSEPAEELGNRSWRGDARTLYYRLRLGDLRLPHHGNMVAVQMSAQPLDVLNRPLTPPRIVFESLESPLVVTITVENDTQKKTIVASAARRRPFCKPGSP